MTSASEVFVVELARVSRKANRFVRHLQRHDREEVTAAAIAWCWENRHKYSLTTTLDTWFVNAIRDAYKAWARGETRNAAEYMAEIPTGDAIEASVAAQQAANVLVGSLTPEYRQVARLEMQGHSRAEMMERGLAKHTIDEARSRIKQLRRLLPDPSEYKIALSRQRYPDSDDLHYRGGNIDREIEALDFPPSGAKECPPCWRCMWFEGWLPGEHKSVRMPIVEPEVAKAVADTETRKIDIAERVRYGTL